MGVGLVVLNYTHTYTHTHRVHAEFQLNDEPNFPFWFTPAQFAGRLIIDRQAEHVEMFELFLPTDKQLNIGTFTLTLYPPMTHISVMSP